MRNRIRSLIFRPSFLSFLIAVSVILALPPLFSKYEIKLVEDGVINPITDAKIYHADIDFDGNSEQINSFTNEAGRHAIQIFASDGGTIDQWNFEGVIANPNSERLLTGDFDKDNLLEVYVLNRIADSIFIDCIDPFDTISPFHFNRIKIFELTRDFAEPDFSISEMYFKDINGDSKEEIILKVNSGRARFPRGIYVYDINNDSVYRSPNFGVNNGNLQLIDLDGDGKIEIFGSNSAAGNVHDSLGVPYSDYSAWIMAFDHELKLLFEPFEYEGFRRCINVLPVYDTLMAIYYHNEGPGENHPELLLMNSKGEVIKKRERISNSKVTQYLYAYHQNDELSYWIIDRNGIFKEYDKDFEFVSEFDLEAIGPGCIDLNLDNDSLSEQVISTLSGILIIAKNNFRDIARFDFKGQMPSTSISVVKRLDQPNLLYLQDKTQYYKLQFGKNPLALYKYLIYLGVFLAIWLFILLINKIQLIRIEKNKRIRAEIVNLQLKHIKSQMDPHFTFNVFNTIASIIKNESSTAYQPFMQFANLMRHTLESSDKITRSIKEELRYLEDYLELEKLRFKEELDYQIEVSPDVDQEIKIPKMLLQTYVENAIKHGIRHLSSKGKLQIKIRRDKKYYEFEVLDNGIGREKANQVSLDSTGYGLKIMKNYFKLFNDYNNAKIKQEITDLYNVNNEPIGTKVLVNIPINFNYNFRKNE